MSQSINNKARLAYISWLVNEFQQHPITERVENLREQLKQEKQEDKIFYQSIKAKLAAC